MWFLNYVLKLYSIKSEGVTHPVALESAFGEINAGDTAGTLAG